MPDLIATPFQAEPHKWDAAQLRFTAFPTPSFETSSTITEIILGKPPARSTADNLQNIFTEETDFDTSRLMVTFQPTRIDVVLAPLQNVVLAPGQNVEVMMNLILGPYNEHVSILREMVVKWMAVKPSLQRIAFAPTLRLQSDDRLISYGQLAKFLPKLEIDGEKMSELLYRINRPRQLVIADKPLKINRISTWSSIRNVYASFNPESKKQTQVQKNACVLQLDISTGPEHTEELPKDELLRIFDKMVLFAEEISQNGDVP